MNADDFIFDPNRSRMHAIAKLDIEKAVSFVCGDDVFQLFPRKSRKIDAALFAAARLRSVQQRVPLGLLHVLSTMALISPSLDS
jgi:hypothetical protein